MSSIPQGVLENSSEMQPLTQTSMNVPAFLNKLWKMVNDPGTDHLISWSQAGISFIIQNQAAFWYELLPLYYKHNNMSSFVRQLNMYGFHKMATIDNSTGESDKDEIQFYHQYFQKNKPELLKNIKRKVTGTSKTGTSPESTNQSVISSGDFFKVLSDVRNLKGKQKSVDGQLVAMKTENGILWRELALLRQKHLKQQQIVNKLIQFLVTMVQPSPRMGNIGVKRHYPLMLHESPKKKMRGEESHAESVTSEGPVIHELENPDLLPGELMAETKSEASDEVPIIHFEEVGASENLTTEINNDNLSANILFGSPEVVDKDMLQDMLSDTELQEEVPEEAVPDRIFLNPTTQDTLLSMMNGSYNSKTLKDVQDTGKKEPENTPDEKAVVAHTLSRLNSIEDFDSHVETTQNELDQLKDLLNGCTTLDANTLLGVRLFNGDSSPGYSLSCNDGNPKNDPLVSGSELATYGNSLDFSQLFDDESGEHIPDLLGPAVNLDEEGSITTPQLLGEAPLFPSTPASLQGEK